MAPAGKHLLIEESSRPSSVPKRDILTELRNIFDPEAIASAGMIIDGMDDPQFARVAIVTAFDDTPVQDLLIYNLGHGGAMSGLLIAARRANNEATFLVFLMD